MFKFTIGINLVRRNFMRGPKTKSINSKITIMVISLILVLSIAFVLISSLLSRNILESTITKDSIRNTEAYSNLIGTWFEERINESKIYADNPIIKTMDWTNIKPYLKKEISQKDEEYYLLGIADKDGNYRTNISDDILNISDRDYFKKAIDGYYALSEPLISKLTGKKVIVSAAPIKNGEEIVGVFLIGIDTTKLYDFIKTFDIEGEKSYVYVIDNKGNIVIHPNGIMIFNENISVFSSNIPEDLTKQSLKILNSHKGNVTYGKGDEKKIAYFYDIPNTQDWKLILVRSSYYLNSPIIQLLIKLGFLGLAVVILGIISSKFVARTISVPIVNLTNVFNQAATGDLTITADETEENEIGRAAKSFNMMMKKVSNMTYYDPLTGLLNRNSFLDRLRVEIGHGKEAGEKLTVFYIAIDKFKNVNDMHGHTGGDALLKQVAQELKDYFGENVVISRMSGDEFLVLLHGYGSQGSSSKIANSVLDIFREPWSVENQEFYITASIGIAIFPEDGESEDEIIKNAGIAKSKVKESGGDGFKFYNREMNDRLQEQITLDALLHNALENNEFIVHYQPFISLKTRKIEAVEALIRWKSPDLGMIPPGKFIPRAEDTGLIVPIGKWVLKEACKQNRYWQNCGFKPICISVNVSAYQFEQEDFVEMVAEIIAETGLEPKYLELEITEGVAMGNVEDKIKKLLKLKALGVKISIDDFGTGYSSLSYLRRFPIDNLKIDQSFVRDIASNNSAKSIISTIVSMGNNLNLGLVAEGVETEEQLEFIKDQNCDKIQGYIFSRPVDEKSFTEMLCRDEDFMM